MTDYDSPWKEALDIYFQPFLALFFPLVYADIDWSNADRHAWIIRLIRNPYERGLSADDVW